MKPSLIADPSPSVFPSLYSILFTKQKLAVELMYLLNYLDYTILEHDLDVFPL